jgi:hypothetical protein
LPVVHCQGFYRCPDYSAFSIVVVAIRHQVTASQSPGLFRQQPERVSISSSSRACDSSRASCRSNRHSASSAIGKPLLYFLSYEHNKRRLKHLNIAYSSLIFQDGFTNQGINTRLVCILFCQPARLNDVRVRLRYLFDFLSGIIYVLIAYLEH